MEEASKMPGINMGKGAVEEVLDIIALGRELQTAKLVLDPNSYGANNKMAMTGSDKWSDPSRDPDQQSKDLNASGGASEEEALTDAVKALPDEAFR